mmetsp:Transcript_25338/g.60248  ORF Transcript_25338/g.60248 Transcript_25338/m.60248 type:complete len:339 (+) Transcript_25338:388-1404(+)
MVDLTPQVPDDFLLGLEGAVLRVELVGHLLDHLLQTRACRLCLGEVAVYETDLLVLHSHLRLVSPRRVVVCGPRPSQRLLLRSQFRLRLRALLTQRLHRGLELGRGSHRFQHQGQSVDVGRLGVELRGQPGQLVGRLPQQGLGAPPRVPQHLDLPAQRPVLEPRRRQVGRQGRRLVPDPDELLPRLLAGRPQSRRLGPVRPLGVGLPPPQDLDLAQDRVPRQGGRRRARAVPGGVPPRALQLGRGPSRLPLEGLDGPGEARPLPLALGRRLPQPVLEVGLLVREPPQPPLGVGPPSLQLRKLGVQLLPHEARRVGLHLRVARHALQVGPETLHLLLHR